MTEQIKSLEQLIQEQQALLQAINDRQIQQKKVILECQELMREHKITAEDIQASLDEDANQLALF